jgi:hypothetical protein
MPENDPRDSQGTQPPPSRNSQPGGVDDTVPDDESRRFYEPGPTLGVVNPASIMMRGIGEVRTPHRPRSDGLGCPSLDGSGADC